MRHILFATIPTDYRRKRITRRIVNVRKGEENKQMIGLETQGEDPCVAMRVTIAIIKRHHVIIKKLENHHVFKRDHSSPPLQQRHRLQLPLCCPQYRFFVRKLPYTMSSPPSPTPRPGPTPAPRLDRPTDWMADRLGPLWTFFRPGETAPSRPRPYINSAQPRIRV